MTAEEIFKTMQDLIAEQFALSWMTWAPTPWIWWSW